jgi:formate dehydrogenase subunit gamma
MSTSSPSLHGSHASSGGDQIERYTFRERICHWFTGFTYLYCLSTGLAFYSPYLFWLAVALGGGPTSRFWHPIAGLAFTAGVIWMHQIWQKDVALSNADRAWLDKVESYAANRDDQVPAQDRFNAGQKVFYWAMFYGAIVLLLSGAVMWFPEYVPSGLRWLRPLVVLIHSASALVTIGAFIIHIYMGIFVVPGSTSAIVHGFVSKDWARTHHRLWYERVTRSSAARE